MTIAIVDSSILLNLLDVPGRNQDRQRVEKELQEHENANVRLLLPFVAIIETGNHISYLAQGRQRRTHAERLVEATREALDGRAPWTPMALPSHEELRAWLDGFPDNAMKELSFADHGILQEWDKTCRRHPGHQVFIWSVDGHLQGYDRPARP